MPWLKLWPVLYLGNLDAKRDWGYAPDYVEAMWKILQQEQPDDYVIGTEQAHSVREFLETAFGYVGLDWQKHVRIDSRYVRPNEVDCMQADACKASHKLGWAAKIFFADLVSIMVDADPEAAGLDSPGEGKRLLKERFDGWHRWSHQLASIDS